MKKTFIALALMVTTGTANAWGYKLYCPPLVFDKTFSANLSTGSGAIANSSSLNNGGSWQYAVGSASGGVNANVNQTTSKVQRSEELV